jgi:hypothetical protein
VGSGHPSRIVLPIGVRPLPSRYLETRYVDPADLHAFPGNPNHADVAELRGSVRRNGQYRPVIARAHPGGGWEILAGHGTTEASGAEAGRVRIEVHDADDATAARIVAIDNTRPKGSVLDEAALLALLDQLADTEGGLDGSGYDVNDTDDLRALLDDTPAGTPTPDENIRHTNGLDDLKDAYQAGASRLVVLTYEGPRYVWVIGALTDLAREYGVDSNADVVARLLEDATGGTAPETREEVAPDGRDDATAPPDADA